MSEHRKNVLEAVFVANESLAPSTQNVVSVILSWVREKFFVPFRKLPFLPVSCSLDHIQVLLFGPQSRRLDMLFRGPHRLPPVSLRPHSKFLVMLSAFVSGGSLLPSPWPGQSFVWPCRPHVHAWAQTKEFGGSGLCKTSQAFEPVSRLVFFLGSLLLPLLAF